MSQVGVHQLLLSHSITFLSLCPLRLLLRRENTARELYEERKRSPSTHNNLFTHHSTRSRANDSRHSKSLIREEALQPMCEQLTMFLQASICALEASLDALYDFDPNNEHF